METSGKFKTMRIKKEKRKEHKQAMVCFYKEKEVNSALTKSVWIQTKKTSITRKQWNEIK